jgi:hypothetical protein
MFREDVKQKIAMELSRGNAARKEGLDGQARVCARRAAAAAIREYLRGVGLPSARPGVIEQLEAGLEIPGLVGELRQAIEHLLLRVDENYALPEEIDLLADARMLAGKLEEMHNSA